MSQRIGLLLLIVVAVGCKPRPAPSMPVGTHGPSGSLVTPEPEHRRLLGIKQPTPAEQAQLMLYEAYQVRGNKRKGLDKAQCEFSPGVVYPVQAQWSFDSHCTSMTVQIKWDARIKADRDIHMAISRVLNKGFFRNLDSFFFVHAALHLESAKQTLKPVNSNAVFYCSSKRTAPNELLIRASTTEQQP